VIGAPVIIGIDPGTACGWAILRGDGTRIASGTWDLSSRRHEGGGMRYLRVRRHVEEMLSQFTVQQLAYEEVRRHMGVDAAHVYGGIVAMIGSVCEERAVPFSAIPVGTVKKLATGKGNASKDMMVLASRAMWGDDAPRGLGEDDEADALFVALAAVRGLA
jgi:Holliday junction resolvasome RuvABC endonuclease subunit